MSDALPPLAVLLALALNLSVPQQRALVRIAGDGMLFGFPRGYGRREDAIGDFISLVTARALETTGFVKISPSRNTSVISLTDRGRRYAGALTAFAPKAVAL